MKENDVDMGDVVLVLGFGDQLFPEGVGGEILPVLVACGHIIEAGHVHEVRHVCTGEDAGVKDGIEVQFFEKRYLSACVKHLYFAGVVLFGGAFVAAELIDPLLFWSLQGRGYCVPGHIGKSLQEDRFDAGIGRIIEACFDVVFSRGFILLVLLEFLIQAGVLFHVPERDEHIDAADGCGIVADGFEDADVCDAHAMEGGEQGGLKIGIETGLLSGCLELIDADGVEFPVRSGQEGQRQGC